MREFWPRVSRCRISKRRRLALDLSQHLTLMRMDLKQHHHLNLWMFRSVHQMKSTIEWVLKVHHWNSALIHHNLLWLMSINIQMIRLNHSIRCHLMTQHHKKWLACCHHRKSYHPREWTHRKNMIGRWSRFDQRWWRRQKKLHSCRVSMRVLTSRLKE